MELEENRRFELHGRKRARESDDGQGGKMRRKDNNVDVGGGGEEKNGRIVAWQHNVPASRIYRVSRASGGKDRHSKVYTAKGLRDRRVRLSVSTAIQFYDLQDRLGYDQPSKAIEWLIKAAAGAIDELPSLDSFMNPPHFGEEENRIVAVQEADPSYNQQQQQHVSPKSGCSSTSDTSKGSVLSLSRSESRVKARERARERVAKEKDKEDGNHVDAVSRQQNLTPNLNSQTSFTELLTGGGGGCGHTNSATATVIANPRPSDIQKQISTADYFSQAGIFSQSQKSHHLTSGFSSHSPFESSSAMAMMPFNIAAGDHSELQQFSILQDNILPVSAMQATPVGTTGDYNLNFTIASGLAGFNRGTLQSNSPSQLHQHHNHGHSHSHIQRLSSVEGSNLPFFFGAAVASAAPSVDHQFPLGFEGRLQLCYGDGFRHSDLKGKGKS